MKRLIGRHREREILMEADSSNRPEFVAIYGRRRVGKTHLVRKMFSSKKHYFELTGLKEGSLVAQLRNFTEEFSQTFYDGLLIQAPQNWHDAFRLLTNEIKKVPANNKITIFFDEIPWLATRRSKFLETLDYYWNSKWSKLNNLVLIVCGSAASWILENLIYAKGGLHNRLTRTILLEPMNLKEAKELLASRSIKLSDAQILNLYMVTGGIPHYLQQVPKGKSAVEVIDAICFQKDGLLWNEFPQLFKSLFDKYKIHEKIIREIAKSRYGISRNELLNKTKFASGGTFNKRIQELASAGFIQSYIPYGKSKKDHYFRIVDEYSLFYLRWIEPVKKQVLHSEIKGYWQTKSQTPAFQSWAGYSFESVCYKHIQQIRTSLGLDKQGCEVGSWRYISPKTSTQKGVQIDLLFDREDGAVTLCEIKYNNNKFTISKKYAYEIMHKIQIYNEQFPSTQQIFFAMITFGGLKQNSWTEDLVDQEVKLKDLFL